MACGQPVKLERLTNNGVTVVGGEEHGIAFGFTERTGGVSASPYASLNLGPMLATIRWRLPRTVVVHLLLWEGRPILIAC